MRKTICALVSALALAGCNGGIKTGMVYEKHFHPESYIVVEGIALPIPEFFDLHIKKQRTERIYSRFGQLEIIQQDDNSIVVIPPTYNNYRLGDFIDLSNIN